MGGPPPQGGGQPSPEKMKSTLVQVLKQVFQVAQQNGLSIDELLSAAQGGGSRPAPPPPPGI